MSEHEERESFVLKNQGQKIFGVLHLPQKKLNPPCVLICHGLGGHKCGRFRVYVELAEKLAKAGIAACRFDFRGSGDSEGSFTEMTLNGEVSDALIVLDFLTSHPFKFKNIGIFGRSLGGAVAVLTAFSSKKISSIVLWAAMFDGLQWQDKWEKISQGIVSDTESEEWRRINGQVANLNFYREMFNMEIPEKLKDMMHIPLLLIHGDKDEVIDLSHSEKYVKVREQSETTTKLIQLTLGDHDFSDTKERAYAVENTVQWFRKTL